MSTFNGKEDNLEFRCRECGYREKIVIDLDNNEDKNKLWKWLQTHSASGGEYVNVPVCLETVPINDRTEDQHKELIEKYGGVKGYLMYLGVIKEE